MKKIFFLILALCCAGIVKAQSLTDQEKIVQQCINLKSLEKLFPEHVPLYIMQHNVSFGNIHPSHNGKKVSFLSKEQIKDQHPDAYFLFWTFNVTGNDALIEFVYNYDQNTTEGKEYKAKVLLEKQGVNWIIKDAQPTR